MANLGLLLNFLIKPAFCKTIVYKKQTVWSRKRLELLKNIINY